MIQGVLHCGADCKAQQRQAHLSHVKMNTRARVAARLGGIPGYLPSTIRSSGCFRQREDHNNRCLCSSVWLAEEHLALHRSSSSSSSRSLRRSRSCHSHSSRSRGRQGPVLRTGNSTIVVSTVTTSQHSQMSRIKKVNMV